VKVAWQIGPGSLDLQWIESGGPPVPSARTDGYGTRVISASIERHLDGSVTFDWRPQGLHFAMAIPLGEKPKSSRSAANGSGAAEEDKAEARRVAGNRLLLVEDEALTGMMMSDMLTELGFDVVGPFGRVADAIAAVGSEDIHGAVLDVNLDGEMVYPVAEAVAARGVPFVFVTGYGAEGIDARFSRIPVLQKPIERQMLQRVFLHGGQMIGAPSGDLPS
jgi:CheY-like chemotaxis protein